MAGTGPGRARHVGLDSVVSAVVSRGRVSGVSAA